MNYNLQFIESDGTLIAEVRNAKAVPAVGTFVQFGIHGYEVITVCHGYEPSAGGDYRDDLIQIAVRPE